MVLPEGQADKREKNQYDDNAIGSPKLTSTEDQSESTSVVIEDNDDDVKSKQKHRPLPRFTTRNRRKTTTIFHQHEGEFIESDQTADKKDVMSLPATTEVSATPAAVIGTGAPEPAPTPQLISFVCGLSAGVIQAGLFNPFDRALYLSVSNTRPFLCHANFRNPYIGFMQSVGHRALSGGLYFPLENLFCQWLLLPSSADVAVGVDQEQYPSTTENNLSFFQKHPAFANFVAGTLAGTSQALICNPISALKYKSWSRDVNRGLVVEAIEMFQKGGIRPFCNGLIPTVLRDLVFGGTYTFLRLEIQYRLQLRQDQQWGANMISAAFATVVSGPFNLARNVQYATRSRKIADGVLPILQDLITETSTRPTLWSKYVYVQSRLRIGWGTVRVAVGMSFGQVLYDRLMGIYEDSTAVHSDHGIN